MRGSRRYAAAGALLLILLMVIVIRGVNAAQAECGGPVPIRTVEPVISPLVYSGGTVVAQVFVDATGRVSDVRVLTRVPALVDPVVSALKQWTFRPAVIDGRPAASCTTVAVHISLVRNVV